jgi:hypothetical protein
MKRINFQIRMFWCAIFAAILLALVWVLSPQQGPVIAYKLALVMLAAFTGYWVHRWTFPYARPDRFLTPSGLVMVNHKRVFAAALICRAIVVGCAMLAVGMGL